ncbi:hypothetical protein HYH02_009064 [Chlamydomonas schloesseri]|uniref:F-box domain-containing protein n=1 Tax=Chlamydomonas schloesseri TaxID=2026947 RepID=A0A835WB27_9CHLO|nr:hypothetical protein HYH02_009064 [Chlamydomonas schloesseri]|eukprot:KAG2444123.1 hypothetical protein HYH02_009064 [Chlamydomonas schloesseri]
MPASGWPAGADILAAAGPKLPRDLWSDILRFLGPRELIKVACVDEFCRDLVYSNEELWRRHCLARWPDCQHGLHRSTHAGLNMNALSGTAAVHDSEAGEQGGMDCSGRGAAATASWRRLFGDLSAAATFRLAFEDATAATEEARTRGEGQHAPVTVERFMQAVHALGLAACAYSSLRCCSAYRRHVHQELGWWLAERPQVLVRFVRSLHVGLMDAQLRGSSTLARMWSSTYCWQRSAVQFLLEAPFWDRLHHQHSPQHQQAMGDAGQIAALQRLLRECEALDATIQRVHKEFPAAMSLGLGMQHSALALVPSSCASGLRDGGCVQAKCRPWGSGCIGPRGLCFDDVEDEAWQLGARAERSAAERGGLLTWRRMVEPRDHWWAWLPC